MPSDSYLRLIPQPLSDAILRSSSGQRLAFAVACAGLAADHCANGVLGLDDGAGLSLSAMRDQVRAATGTREAESIDRALASREDGLYAQLCALRAGDSDAPYGEFVRLSTLRHAVRALRAALSRDSVAAAASAAFETISATRSESDVERLQREMLAP